MGAPIILSDVLSPKRKFPGPNMSNMSVDKPWAALTMKQDATPVDFAKIMKMLSSKETRKHSINLTERLLNDSVIGFGFKERKVDKITRKQVFSNLTRTIAKSTLEKSIEDMAPILQGQSGYHQLIVDQKIPMNQPEKSILERNQSRLITEEDEAYFRLSFEEQLKTKDTSNEPVPPHSFEYSTNIPKVITTEK